jgi:protein gp37
MGEITGVEYVKHTFSAWHGCHHVSAGCLNCFAEKTAQRWGNSDLWHMHGPRRIVSESTWYQPRKWNEEARREGMRARVLCGTMFDFLEDHPQVGEARARLFRLIEDTPWLLWLLFTKRPENAGMIPWGNTWPDNTGLIASVENQEYTKRIPPVLDTAAPLKGLSVEPLIGPVNLETCSWAPSGWEGYAGTHNPLTGEWWPAIGDPDKEYANRLTGMERLDWIIIGGESGRDARPMHPKWALDVYRQCQNAGVPVWFKQWGEWGPVHGGTGGDVWTRPQRHLWVDPVTGKTKPFGEFTGTDDMEWEHMQRLGKGAAGHLLDGREIQELPAAAYLTPEGRVA